MKQHSKSWLSACVVVGLMMTACSTERRSAKSDTLTTETAGAGGAGGAGTSGYSGASGYGAYGGSDESDAAVEPSFEPFDIALNQTITVGAFSLIIEKAAVTPQIYQYDERARVELAFVAHNLSTEQHTPLNFIWSGSDALLLDIDGEYFYGEVRANEVPSLRKGVGKMCWLIPTADISPERIAAATVTIGDASQTAVVISLADPASSTTLNDIELDVAVTVQGIRPSTLKLTSGRIQYGSRNRNEPYDAGTAYLVLLGGLGGPPDVFDAWSSDEIVLDRPDGISVASDFSAVINEQPEDAEIYFEIVQPVSGTYALTVYGDDGKSVMHSIVVP